jgi:CheY-like chemotaxis protein
MPYNQQISISKGVWLPMQYKVMIVEDDESTARIMAISLKRLGFETDIVNHGELAIGRMKEWKPDVVVLDLELPGKDGVQILREMFFDPILRNLIVIANSVHIDAKDNLGFAYYGTYVQAKGQEPVMLNKLQQDEGKEFNIKYVIYELLGKKFGSVPKALEEWVQRNDPYSQDRPVDAA